MADVLDKPDTDEKDESRLARDGEGLGAVEAERRDATDDLESEPVEAAPDELLVEPIPPEPQRRPLYRRPVFLIVAAFILLAAALLGLRYWLYARSHESTDDAFIDGRIVQLSPKVSGYVAKVYVTDNQQVKEGDLIAELDARDYEVRLS